MEILRKWSINYYLKSFYCLFICIAYNLVLSAQDLFSYFYRVNQWNLHLVSIQRKIYFKLSISTKLFEEHI